MTSARSGRFAGERAPAFVALNSSLALDWRLWPEDIQGSVAHARALEGAGLLSAAEREAIEDGLAAVGREVEAGEFVPADADEDVHMAIEVWMTEHATCESNCPAPSIADALASAEEVHNSMTVGYYNAYVWWWDEMEATSRVK